MPAAVESAFDIAFWFLDQALDSNEYLQPQKLHRLMFLAQAYYAVAYHGHRLMPAVFVADDAGPLEPTIYKAFERGRPDVEVNLLPPQKVEMFLEGVWRRFGHHSVAHLTRLTKASACYQAARKKAHREEITIEAMRKAFTNPEEGPDLRQVVKPKLMRSHTGRAVAVKSWLPRAVKTTGKPGQRST